jgi:hypothetical protein
MKVYCYNSRVFTPFWCHYLENLKKYRSVQEIIMWASLSFKQLSQTFFISIICYSSFQTPVLCVKFENNWTKQTHFGTSQYAILWKPFLQFWSCFKCSDEWREKLFSNSSEGTWKCLKRLKSTNNIHDNILHAKNN